MRHRRAALLVTALFAGGTALAAAPAQHPAGHGAAATRTALDERSAIAFSQGAVGKVVRDAAFTTPDGRRVRLTDYRGKPVVVSLIYTGCYHICPTTTRHLAKVVRGAREALGDESFTVLTIGFDAPNDSPEAMGAFARHQNVAMRGWEFLSADAATIARLSEDLGFHFAATPKGFDHVVQASVLDAGGKVYRQVYGVQFETPHLVEPLKELVYATPPNASFFAHLGNRVKLFCTVYDPATDRYRVDYSLFIGMFVGAVGLGSVGFLVVREWRRPRGR